MTRVAIAGLGAIGRVLARKLADGMPGLTLACAAVRDRKKAQTWLDAQQISCPLVEPEEFPARADLAIECAPAAVLEKSDLRTEEKILELLCRADQPHRRRPGELAHLIDQMRLIEVAACQGQLPSRPH